MAIQLEVEEWTEVCNRVQRAEAQRDQLREALEGLQSDCKQGKWIERDRWLQVSAALKATEGNDE